jgi:hypothetical protein
MVEPYINQRKPNKKENVMDDINNKKLKPKEVLKDIWESNTFGPYKEVDTAVNISRHITKEHLEGHKEIVNLVKSMVS